MPGTKVRITWTKTQATEYFDKNAKRYNYAPANRRFQIMTPRGTLLCAPEVHHLENMFHAQIKIDEEEQCKDETS